MTAAGNPFGVTSPLQKRDSNPFLGGGAQPVTGRNGQQQMYGGGLVV